MIKEIKVIGNKATVILSSETEGTIGYDYVILTERQRLLRRGAGALFKFKFHFMDKIFIKSLHDKWVCQVFCVSFKKNLWGGKPPRLCLHTLL